MNEVVQLFRRCFSQENNTIHYWKSNSIDWVVKMLIAPEKVIEHDAPDYIAQINNEFLIIEHFEFDAYKNTKKGSQSRREQARIKQIERTKDRDKDYAVFHNQINGKTSYAQYITNVKSSFLSHYNSIPQYKANLEKESIIINSSIVKTMFLIEDASPLGSMAIDDNDDIQAVTIALSKEFLEFLKDKNDIDYVLTVFYFGNDYYAWLIDMEFIDEYISKSYDYRSWKFVELTPQSVGVRITYKES